MVCKQPYCRSGLPLFLLLDAVKETGPRGSSVDHYITGRSSCSWSERGSWITTPSLEMLSSFFFPDVQKNQNLAPWYHLLEPHRIDNTQVIGDIATNRCSHEHEEHNLVLVLQKLAAFPLSIALLIKKIARKQIRASRSCRQSHAYC